MFGFGAKVEVLSDAQLNGEILEVIRSAARELVIVSPYVGPGANFISQLVDRAKVGTKVELILRRDKVSEYRAEDWFRRLIESGVILRSVDRLHAKIYANDETVMTGSANFFADSWSNSRELMVAFQRDSAEGRRILEYVAELRRDSDVLSAGASNSVRRSPKVKRVAKSAEGYCIGCGDTLALNLDRPSCRDCYGDLKDGGDGEACHTCGDDAKTSIEKPQCYSCFKAA